MGINPPEQFGSMAYFVPFYCQDHQLINKLFLIRHDTTDAKDAHMSVLVDLAGTSTETHIKGVLCHVVANTKDGQIPHSTSVRCDPWEELKSNLSLIYVGNLAESKYLNGVDPLPPCISHPLIQNNVHRHLVDPNFRVSDKQSMLYLLTNCLHSYLAEQYQPKWTANLNCQQFARRFIEEAIGLSWPNDVLVAGDKLPMMIDIGILYISSKNKKKRKKQKNDTE